MIRVQSQEARTGLRRLLTKVEHGEAVEISRWQDPVAVMVPPDWYRRAAEAVGEPGSDPQ